MNIIRIHKIDHNLNQNITSCESGVPNLIRFVCDVNALMKVSLGLRFVGVAFLILCFTA